MKINSNRRKLILSGLYKTLYPEGYRDPLKLQKFLFFYEAFSKTLGEEYDFYKLQGYKNGPVFGTVYGDYKYRKEELSAKALEEYSKYIAEKSFSKDIIINFNNAKVATFLTRILNDKDLSSLSHKYNIWNKREHLINDNEKFVILADEDYDDEDNNLSNLLIQMYSTDLINGSDIYSIGDYNFLFSKEDFRKLNSNHLEILKKIANTEELHNPVYVVFDEDGSLIID